MFVAYWAKVKRLAIDARIDVWASEYMASWPELLAKQQECYSSEGDGWRGVAHERVFPYLAERLPAMREAHGNLLAVCLPTVEQARAVLGYRESLTLVIYVGIGRGAGWATEYAGSSAVLFGLENIAECGWTDRASLAGLVAHEVGYLLHQSLRAEAGPTPSVGPFWQLHEEGFPQRCEHLALGESTWHEARGLNPPGWLEWCSEHRGELAAEFLRRADSGRSVRDFFGSWFEYRGWRQCGYYLGHELVRCLEASSTLDEVAWIQDVDDICRRALESLADQG